MNKTISIGNIISACFGILFMIIGLINTFCGNDPGFGLFIIVISTIYFTSVSNWIAQKTGVSIKPLIKIGLGVFIIWAALGVGELFDKMDMAMHSFNLK